METAHPGLPSATSAASAVESFPLPTIDFEKELNPRQLEAVRHFEGPLLILAGAGSGKTRVLMYRIACLVERHGAHPSQILAVTFTNKAADEMRSRIETLLARAGRSADGLTMGTFHSVCLRLLRRYGRVLGLPANFVVYDEDDQEKTLLQALKKLDLSTETNPVRYILSRIQRLKDAGLGADGISPHDLFASRLRRIYQAYEELMRDAGALDFGDLLVHAVRLLKDHPEILDACRDRWRFIEVDEYQDTNAVQFEFLSLLAGPTGNLCVVGDDDQSIYRWRGAELRNILDFEKKFAGCHVVRLEQNYRSTQTILAAASSVVRRNVARKGKELWTENREGEALTLLVVDDEVDEAERVCREIQALARRGRRLNDMAVFYRTNAQSRVFEEVLVQWSIDYQIVGSLRFYERKEIKDVLAFLRLLVNPRDRAGFTRVVSALPWGVGDASIAKLDAMKMEKGVDFLEAMALAADDPAFKGKVKAGLIRISDFFAGLRSKAAMDRPVPGVEGHAPSWPAERAVAEPDPARGGVPPSMTMDGRTILRAGAGTAEPRGDESIASPLHFSDLVTHVVKASGYLEALAAQHPEDIDARRDNLRQLVSGMNEFSARFPSSGLDDYLSYVTLMTRADDFKTGVDRITLMTLHCAKGLEFPVVFIVGLEEELFPLMRRDSAEHDIEEERRLFYVGMTRAEEKLYLSCARTRQLFGRTRYRTPSRFLSELPEGSVKVEGARDW